ncbi:MAG: UDP-glucose 4-epimerase [Ignavibacteria bacterium GWB2_35_12]|nr:MAG: UDP-glucose 4-epimerase [Ignavibacteria bacterium GWA2_35_8]OGU41454.1 MAG: UDP-glucose 4-epimerase [Ignavibacteria bacterium GWB2_35_12]OGU94982.1 MAG: UDP-glucose 4-epimerase [Ignavibacteria bacterium RIFOXYA2_FULL_35_10]OGV19369.1 MAG: UDP-glucose 4-epimerase [Ignavibacteria bacterium RIFOXYC2_FULL_35_21]
MKILVTGGAGFIASHIVDAYINAGLDVFIIDNFSTGRRENVNPKATLIEMDINDEKVDELFKKEKFDIINHHAAQMDVRFSVDNPGFDAATNILGSLNLYESAKNHGVKKIIFASTGGAVYGEQDYFPADENHPTRPCSPYGIAKLANEKYLFYYKEVYGIDHVALRYVNVYGPKQNPHGEAGVVAIFINKMISGSQPIINGDGLNTRDYVYVADVVKANLLALNENVSGIYNVATGIEHDVNFIFRTLKELTKSDCKEIHGEAKAGEQRRSVCTSGKIYKEHGWKPDVLFNEGLSKTVDYFKKNLR